MEDKQMNPQQRPQPAGESKVRKGLILLSRILVAILTLLLIVTAVIVVVFRDQVNLDSVKRYLTYQALERNDKGVGAEFDITADKTNSYAALDDCLIACSNNRIQIYSNGGSVYVDMQVSIFDPVILAEGNYALIYDAGGSELYLFSERQLIHEYKAEEGSSILSARVNSNGWLVIIEEAAGYKASATVYNDRFQPVMTQNISSSFVIDGVVSPDNRKLALITIGQEETKFASTLRIYDCGDGAETVSRVISNEPPLDLRWDEDGFWLQELNSLRRLDDSGSEVGLWEDESLHLQGFSLSGDGFAVEYYSRYRAGNAGTLMVIDEKGAISAQLDLNEEILSVSASGRYIGVLTHSGLTIYTSSLNRYAYLDNDTGIVKAIVRSDGTAMLVSEKTASVFLP